jgi:hypothetical protein
MDGAKRMEAPIINRRLQSEKQQKKSRQAGGAQEHIDSIRDAIVITDGKEKRARFNRTFRVFWMGNEVVGGLPTKFVYEKDVPRLEEIVKEAMRDPLGRGSLKDFDCTLITEDKKDPHKGSVRCSGFCRCSADVYFRRG